MSPQPKKLRVLIAGAGIGGPCLAWWLHRGSVAQVTIVERDPKMRATGQSIDLRGSAISIVESMGLLKEIKKHTTNEAGMRWIDENGKTKAEFAAAPPGSDVQSFTSEFEIFRGDLAQVFYLATKDCTEYIFDDYITSVSNEVDKVRVELKNASGPREFDVVIGADGIGSQLRAMTFNVSRREFLKPLGGWFGYFTIDKDHLNGSKFAVWYGSQDSRIMLLRPDPQGRTRANLGCWYHSDMAQKEAFREAHDKGGDAFKSLMRKKFEGAGWITPEILDGMDIADDFYVQELAQVHMPQIFKGRVAFVGDAASCPTPISGQGTSLAIIQAYILAGELFRNASDIEASLQSYNDLMQPIMKDAQTLHGSPRIMAPKSKFGVNLMLNTLAFVTFMRIDKAIMSLASLPMFKGKKTVLPDYKWPEQKPNTI